MKILAVSAKPKRYGGRRTRRIVGAIAVLAALVLSGCGAGRPATERTMHWQRADLMYIMNRPNVTGENPDTEQSDSVWWFY